MRQATETDRDYSDVASRFAGADLTNPRVHKSVRRFNVRAGGFLSNAETMAVPGLVSTSGPFVGSGLIRPLPSLSELLAMTSGPLVGSGWIRPLPSLSELLEPGFVGTLPLAGMDDGLAFSAARVMLDDPTSRVGSTVQADRNAALSAEIIAYRNLHDGWDGKGSIAPRASAIQDALLFIDKIPFGAKLPDTTVAADGEVGFYWSSADGYIDIGFKGDGTISYFARADGHVAHGVEPYGPDYVIPRELGTIIDLV